MLPLPKINFKFFFFFRFHKNNHFYKVINKVLQKLPSMQNLMLFICEYFSLTINEPKALWSFPNTKSKCWTH